MIKVLHPETGLPQGQRSHTSGPTEGGYLISVVWDSKEQERGLHAEHAFTSVAGRRRIRWGSGGARCSGRPPRFDLTRAKRRSQPTVLQ